MKKIILFCDGGLGNRMNVLMSGLILAKKTNRIPIINWPENVWSGASFNQLFSIDDVEVNNADINRLFNQYKDTAAFLIHTNQTNLSLKKVFNTKEYYIDQIKEISDDVIVYYTNSIPGRQNVSLEEKLEVLAGLKIHPYILNEVDSFCSVHNIDTNVIGYHLRRTDLPLPPSTDDVYRIAINNINKSYFICSDDESVENQLGILPNIIFRKKTAYVEKYMDGNWRERHLDDDGRYTEYNIKRTANSVIDAMIDILILSRTNIQQLSLSSFLELSVLFNKLREYKK